LFYF
jgi:hypothetical protein